MLLALNAMASYAYDFEVDGIEYNLLSLDDRTVEVVNTHNIDVDITEITIPESIEFNGQKLKVVSIGSGAFRGPSNLYDMDHKNRTKIHLPATIETIKEEAFSHQKLLEEIEMPASLTSIEDYAFWYCAKLRTVTFKDKLKSVGSGAFSDCVLLEEVSLPEGLEHIGSHAFYNAGIKSIQLPTSLQTIGQAVFSGCRNLEFVDLEPLKPIGQLPSSLLAGSGVKRVVIPDWVTEIPVGFLCQCKNLKEVNFGNSAITHIGQDAFRMCVITAPFSLPESVKSIGAYAFANSVFTDSFALPKNLELIEEYAFEACEIPVTITLPEHLKIVKYYTFNNAKIKGIVVPASVEVIGENAFAFVGDSLVFQPSENPLLNDGAGWCYASSDGLIHLDFLYQLCSGVDHLKLERKITNEQYENRQELFPTIDFIKQVLFYDAKVVELSKDFLSNQLKFCRSDKNGSFYSNAVRLVILDGVEELNYQYNCEETHSLLLPSTLKTLSATSFIEASGLTNVDCRAIEPPMCDGKSFSDHAYFKATLTVPVGSKEAYQNAEGWKHFLTIEECDEPVYNESMNGIISVENDSEGWFTIKDGKLQTSGTAEVYSLNGQLVKRAFNGDISDVAHGMYIVKCGTKRAKIVL